VNIEFIRMDADRDWASLHNVLPVNLCADTKGIIAVDTDTNAPVAVCIMDNWTHTAVQVHFAVMRPMVLRHGFLEEIAYYVYDFCGRDLMIGLVPASNEKALKLDKHIGFEEVYRVKDGYDVDVDYVILELRKENCRWLTSEPVQVAEVH
jgi:hypothetical protein